MKNDIQVEMNECEERKLGQFENKLKLLDRNISMRTRNKTEKGGQREAAPIE